VASTQLQNHRSVTDLWFFILLNYHYSHYVVILNCFEVVNPWVEVNQFKPLLLLTSYQLEPLLAREHPQIPLLNPFGSMVNPAHQNLQYT